MDEARQQRGKSHRPCAALALTAVLAVAVVARAKADDAPTLADVAAGRATIIDLAYTLNEQSAYWPGENYEPFRLKTIATLEKDGVLSKAFSCPEHIGTHIDAPNHFGAGQIAVDQIEPADLFAPGVMIDVRAEVAHDSDFLLTRRHVEAWEKQHGQIPAGAVVLLQTGWGKFWTRRERYLNRDVRGRLHFPGYAADAARLIIGDRKARGVGIDTLSMDYGLSRDFAVHHVVNSAGRYGLENVAHLDRLPPRGFWLVIAPIKIETGTGGPTRVFAILPGDASEGK